jgi:hypothetical protein
MGRNNRGSQSLPQPHEAVEYQKRKCDPEQPRELVPKVYVGDQAQTRSSRLERFESEFGHARLK